MDTDVTHNADGKSTDRGSEKELLDYRKNKEVKKDKENLTRKEEVNIHIDGLNARKLDQWKSIS